jgi:Family of unknown function (DUF6049)
VHALLPATAKRRTGSLAAVAVLALITVSVLSLSLALARPAQASAGVGTAARSGTVSVVIDSMNPPFARSGTTVTMKGTVTNGTRAARTGLEVALSASSVAFQTRSQMDSYLARGAGVTLLPAGSHRFALAGSLQPGATARWSASFRVGDAGISGFGVYPVAAQVADTAGEILASDRTLLPFWPGRTAAGLLRPLNIAWAWPLIDQPHYQACSTLSTNDLAAALGQDGRLSALLDAGKARPGAQLTWFIDPALLRDASTMTRPYQVASNPTCTSARKEPASTAARTWLATLRTVVPRQQTVITPYANVDMTALVRNGLSADLTSAFATGGTVARAVLHGTFRPSIVWPAGGTANLSVLTNLAAAEHVGTVVLKSSEMRPTASRLYHGDDAVTSIRTGAGTTMNVLLTDDTLTEVLRTGNTGSGALPQGTEFAVKQRFLAETAMIAAQEPNSARSVVVAPPQDWSPSAALAGDLLDETASAPWLHPATLGSLPGAPDTERAVPRQSPPASKASPGELGRSYLSQVGLLGANLGLYKSMLYRPRQDYVLMLDEVLAATESAAWRGNRQAQGVALWANLWQYLLNAQKKVRFITSAGTASAGGSSGRVAAPVSMGGSSGRVPVSIQNGLLHQAIQVRLGTSVKTTPGRTSQLTIGPFQSLIVIQPHTVVTVKLPVSSAPQGSTVIKLSLSTANGKPLRFADTQLTVQSTRYGRAILFLIGAAIGVLVLTSLYRSVRRWLRDDRPGRAEIVQQAGQPGSVVTGTSGARYPTEAPDDLADARRWADDA